jgi:phytoene dehydrogenase-like protein
MIPPADVIVIGAGHNGLVCAFYLAAAGLKVTIVEARDVVGGAAVTEEFAPGFRNSTASYTISLLQPKVIHDMALASHGLKVVLRRTDNFLPTQGGDYLLSGRGGLTRREIARHAPADAERYDDYLAALDSVVRVLKDWLLRAPPNTGGGVADLLRLASLGRGIGRLGIEEQRRLVDFFTCSAAEILERYFSHDLVQALFGFDGVVGNFASPWTPGSAYVSSTICSAKRTAYPEPGAMRSAAWAASPRPWPTPAAPRAWRSSPARRWRKSSSNAAAPPASLRPASSTAPAPSRPA